jgi:O-methyltransferase domain/Dimerisation domain
LTRPRYDDTKVVQALDGMLGGLAFLVSYDLKLFQALGHGPQTAAQLAAALHIGERPAEALLGVAAAQGFVQCSNDVYALTPMAEEYLLPQSPTCYGGMIDLRMAAMPVYTFETLKKSVLTDTPQAYGDRDVFSANAEDSSRAQAFTRAMHSRSMAAALAWPQLLDLSGHHKMLDIGGGSGAHSIGAALHWPQLSAIVLDLAPVCSIAAQYVEQERLSDRIHTHPSDMFEDRFPTADLHFYGNVYHDWPAEKCRFLTSKSYGALPSGGRLVIHEVLYDDDKNGPLEAAIYSVVMLLWQRGRQYSGRELTSILREAGFSEIEVKRSFGLWSVVCGRKP